MKFRIQITPCLTFIYSLFTLSREALAAFQKMANKLVNSDNEDSCEGEVTSNIATGDFLSLFQSASANREQQQNDTLSWMKEEESRIKNDNLSNTTTIATGDFLHLFQTIESNNDGVNTQDTLHPNNNHNDFGVDHTENLTSTTNFATGDFLHLFQKVETNNTNNSNDNNDNYNDKNYTTDFGTKSSDNTFATGDFLTLFQASQNVQADQVWNQRK